MLFFLYLFQAFTGVLGTAETPSKVRTILQYVQEKVGLFSQQMALFVAPFNI